MGLLDVWKDKYIDFRSSTMRDPHQEIKTRNVSPYTHGKIERVVFHCTDAPSWSPERLSRFFVDERHWPICGYHYYVMADGVYQMVDENVITNHAAPWNSHSVAFSIDYFPTQMEKYNQDPDKTVLENARLTAAILCLKFHIAPDMLVGHRELKFTGWFPGNKGKIQRKECPGMRIDLDVFRHDVSRLIQEEIRVVVDGVWGPKSQSALDVYP